MEAPDSATPVPDAPKPKRRWRRVFFKFVAACLALLVFFAGAVAVGGYLIYKEVNRATAKGAPVKLVIPPGASGRSIGLLLVEKGIIQHELLFRVTMRFDKSQKPVKHGPYTFRPGAPPRDILRQLQEGPNRPWDPEEIPEDRRVTVPEGLSLVQASALFADPSAFVEAASDPALIKRLGLTTPTLEGFLFPSTYFFDEKPAPRQVVERMVETFEKEYASLLTAIPAAAQKDRLAILTVASLIEEEAKVDSERPLISAVIWNRLAKGMRLQMDSTLQYALGKYGERMLEADKQVNSLYNTYQHEGLPPGPICSPGLACIRAAMEPAAVDYLYFVSNADGKTHTFSTKEADHLEAVRRYRQEMAIQRKAQSQ